MTDEFRGKSHFVGHGPFLAIVTNHLDPTYMGGLEVMLIRRTTGNKDHQGQTVQVQYLSPFYGVTSVNYEGTNSANFNDVQKSYGMWAVPPDIGTTVLVIFIDGDMNQGFWIGCVQDRFQNYMVPGIAASKNVEMTPEQQQKYGTTYLPVGEFNKSTRTLSIPKPDQFGKPVHPFADRLLAQGLLLDTVRGVTSSSARREVPSMVFGISTPGPIDGSQGAKKATIGYDSKILAPVSRLGGSTFVMDDGDKDGLNELVRIRTRTGHQILLHNSSDLIYIGNASGNAWIELTSNGKIDMYAADSVSIHTQADFNFKADRDVNIEAGRNINMSAGSGIEMNCFDRWFVIAGADIKLQTPTNFNINASQQMRITSASDMHLLTNGNWNTSVSGTATLGATGDAVVVGSKIQLNSVAGNPAVPADLATKLTLYTLPNSDKSAGWSQGKFYKSADITSIMQRVPTHEPYVQHENINPTAFSAANTDVSTQVRPDTPPPSNTSVTPAVVQGVGCSVTAGKLINAASSQAGIAALKAAAAGQLTTPIALASLLAIVGGESKWTPIQEGYNYSSSRLTAVFSWFNNANFSSLIPKYSGWTGSRYDFFSFIYGPTTPSGKNLGNTTADQGGKYYGRGYIQLTGYPNYKRYAQLSGVDILGNPDLLLDPTNSAKIAVAYLLDRCKADQNSPAYFDAAVHSVGYCTPDIYATKKDLYLCFLANLQGQTGG